MGYMNKERVYIVLTSKWDEKEDAYVINSCIENIYDLTKKEDLKQLAVDSVNYLVRGFKIELISISKDFISMISKYDTLYIGYTNRFGEYHEFNISDVVFPSEEYGSDYFDAFCIDGDGEPEGIERTFKIDRIDFIKESDVKEDNDESESIIG